LLTLAALDPTLNLTVEFTRPAYLDSQRNIVVGS
jgi:hypothetical protein